MHRHDPRNGSAPIGHLNGLARSDATQHRSCILPKLPDPNPVHVAHCSTSRRQCTSRPGSGNLGASVRKDGIESSANAEFRHSRGPSAVRRIAAVLETAGFATAGCAYLLPFLSPVLPPLDNAVIGLQVFFTALYALLSEPRPWGLITFAAYGAPLIAAIAALFLHRRPTRPAPARLIFGLVGIAGLATAYAGSRGAPWAFGYWLAVGAFVVATVAAGYRFVTTLWFRDRGWDRTGEG